MTDCLQMNLMFDVTAFSIFRAKKFSACRQVIEKRAHLDLSSRRLAAIAHDIDLTAIDGDLGSCDCANVSRGETKTRAPGDARERFAAKCGCRACVQIG